MHSPFDTMAETYDADFTNTAIGQLQRKQVWELLTPLLDSNTKPLKILEINCGTGEDAVELEGAGHDVTATDGSQKMVERARQKAAALGKNRIVFRVCEFERLSQQLEHQKFDLVISNFGGLNCIDQNELEILSTQLSSLLNEQGKLFFVIMGSGCLWEIFYYIFKGRAATAFRRQRKLVRFRSGDAEIPVFYHSPSRVKKIFHSLYDCCYSKPIGLFIPPSYLEKQFQKRQNWLQSLTRLETKFNRYPALSNFADHYCIVFQKKGSL
jgi:SAM-dependent methyltransferase